MYQDKIVLCGASAYEQKYYFNQDFSSLPDAVKQELRRNSPVEMVNTWFPLSDLPRLMTRRF